MSKPRKLYNPKRYVVLVEEDTFFTFQRTARSVNIRPSEVIRTMIDMYVAEPERDDDITLLTRHLEHQINYLIKDNQFDFAKLHSWFTPKVLNALNTTVMSKRTKHSDRRVEVTYGEFLNVTIDEHGNRVIRSSAHDIIITHNAVQTIITLPDSYSAANNYLQLQVIIRDLVLTLDGLVRVLTNKGELNVD